MNKLMNKLLIVITAAGTLIAVCTGILYASGTYGTGCSYGHHALLFGPHWYGAIYGGGVFMMIFNTVIFGLLIFFGIKYLKVSRNETKAGEDPLVILKTRYAKGEISRDEFISMKSEMVN